MLSDALKSKIIKHLRNKTAVDDWSMSDVVISSREGIIYKASSASHPHDIAIKHYRDASNPDCITQYEALKYYGSSLNQSDSKLRVPAVYGSFPEEGIFLMEWVDNLGLWKRLWRFCYSKSQQFDDVSRVFSWLKLFHHHADKKLSTLSMGDYQEVLTGYIERHDGDQLLSENAIFKSGIDSLNNSYSLYEGLEVIHAKSHGDFTPTNVLIDDNTVTSIDLFANQQLPVVNDIALQLSYLIIEYPNMLPKAELKKQPLEWEILNLCLSSYEYSTDVKQRELLLLVLQFQLLRRWLVIVHRNKNKRALLPTLIDKWRLKNTEIIVERLTKFHVSLNTK